MNKLIALIVTFPLIAFAQPFVEAGLGYSVGGIDSCISDYNNDGTIGCSSNPLGILALGWKYKDFTIQAEHYSSLVEKDKGLNLFSIRYRFNLFDDK